METKFTRGEWKILKYNYTHAATINKDTTHRICAIETGYGHADEWESNAKLISKSPQMFETITNFIHWIEKEKETVSGALLAEMDSAKKLIKKITE